MERHKSFDFINIPVFDILRLMCVPFSCCFNNYQHALNVYLGKSKSKIVRELEVSQLLKRIRDTKNLTRSYEKQELFKGLNKKYKYHYDNIVNVSLDTNESIAQEHGDAILPNEAVYQHKKPKTYVQMKDEGENNGKPVVYGQLNI
jgi:hypothetical protein